MQPSPTRRKLGAPSIPVAATTGMDGKAPSPRVGSRRKNEDGYMLLTAIFLLAILVVSLAIAMPSVIKSIQRDRDLETFHRGMQYRRAIQLYYRKFHAYPPNADALVNTNQIKFLRKKYPDPLTGKADWKPVLFGQNKAPTAMGFFGQPLGGNASTIAGIGPSGGNGLGPGNGSMGSPPLGSPALGGSGGIFGSSGSSSTTGSSNSTDNSGGNGSAGAAGSSGASGSSSSSSSSSGFGTDSGQTFGGAGIIGFSPVGDKQSILLYKKKNHYNEWEFTYDPLSEMKTISGNTGMIGQSAASTSSAVGSSTFGSSSFGSSSSSSSSGSSSSGSQSTSP